MAGGCDEDKLIDLHYFIYPPSGKRDRKVFPPASLCVAAAAAARFWRSVPFGEAPSKSKVSFGFWALKPIWLTEYGVGRTDKWFFLLSSFAEAMTNFDDSVATSCRGRFCLLLFAAVWSQELVLNPLFCPAHQETKGQCLWTQFGKELGFAGIRGDPGYEIVSFSLQTPGGGSITFRNSSPAKAAEDGYPAVE